MKELLWVIVIVGALNTAAVFVSAAIGSIGEVSGARVFDWFWNAGLAIWALVLLVSSK